MIDMVKHGIYMSNNHYNSKLQAIILIILFI